MLSAVAAGLATALRRAGVPVTVGQAARFAAATQLAGPSTVDGLYWVARATLVARQDEVPAFDTVFATVFRGLADPADFRGQPPEPAVQPGAAGAPDRADDSAGPSSSGAQQPGLSTGDSDGAEGDGAAVLAAASSTERLRTTSFAELTEEELTALRGLMRSLTVAPPPRRSRRTESHPAGRRVDLRRTLADARRTAGDPVRLARRRPRHRPRRLVVLCDISASMEPYARAYVQFLACAAGGARAETFVFATRLTRITRALRSGSPDVALRRAAEAAPDWSGGTRIGAAVHQFVDRWGRPGLARGAVVVIVSDGWERDDPELLGRQMARLGRLAHRVVWVNPRRAAAGYRPLVGGMAAALPHVDAFVAGHTYDALAEVVAAIADRS